MNADGHRWGKGGVLGMLLLGMALGAVSVGTVSVGMGEAIASTPTRPTTQTRPLLPRPPRTPPPNRTRAGGSLGTEQTCGQGDSDLMAILPEQNPVYTMLAQPTVLVYVPYGATEVQSAEFSVLVGIDETQALYRTRLDLPDAPGVVRITLPSEVAIAPNEFYHWYFKINCAGNTTRRADLTVDGWFQRLPATPERQQQITSGTPEIWYDAIAQIAQQLQQTPADNRLKTQWAALLQSVGAERAIASPILEAEIAN